MILRPRRTFQECVIEKARVGVSPRYNMRTTWKSSEGSAHKKLVSKFQIITAANREPRALRNTFLPLFEPNHLLHGNVFYFPHCFRERQPATVVQNIRQERNKGLVKAVSSSVEYRSHSNTTVGSGGPKYLILRLFCATGSQL